MLDDPLSSDAGGKPTFVSRRLDLIKTMRTAGIGLFMAVAVLPRVNAALQAAVAAHGDLMAWGKVLLYFAVLMLIAAWIVSSYLEVNYLSAWATRIPYQSVSPTLEAFMVVLVALSLSVLLAFVEDVHLFGYAYTLYAAIDLAIWTTALRKALLSIFESSIAELEEASAPVTAGRAQRENQAACLKKMHAYYASPVQLWRRAGMLLLALALLPLTHFAASNAALAGMYAAYAALILAGEGVLLSARIAFDRSIFEHESIRQRLQVEEAG